MQTVDRNALPKLTTDLEQARRDLTEWGYCLLANAISEDLRKRLLDRLTEQADLEGEQGVAYMADGHTQMRSIGAFDRTAKPAWQQVTGLLNKGRPFVELMMNANLHALSAHAFEGNSFDLCSIRGLIQRKGAADGAMHIDQILVPFLTPLPVLCNLTVTLTEYTIANGATRVVPGSHKLHPPHMGGDPDPMPEVALEAPPGTALVWEGRTWHRAAADNSDAERIGVVVVTNMLWVRQQDVYAAGLHDRVYESMTPEERYFAGFMSSGFNTIYPRFPGDRSNPIAGTLEPQTYVPELHRAM
jgi:ectoine hydroxylase-related dioxygenase (phytanoyl-CoA dioxygenase family)